jgi:hypothetical protein
MKTVGSLLQRLGEDRNAQCPATQVVSSRDQRRSTRLLERGAEQREDTAAAAAGKGSEGGQQCAHIGRGGAGPEGGAAPGIAACLITPRQSERLQQKRKIFSKTAADAHAHASPAEECRPESGAGYPAGADAAEAVAHREPAVRQKPQFGRAEATPPTAGTTARKRRPSVHLMRDDCEFPGNIQAHITAAKRRCSLAALESPAGNPSNTDALLQLADDPAEDREQAPALHAEQTQDTGLPMDAKGCSDTPVADDVYELDVSEGVREHNIKVAAPPKSRRAMQRASKKEKYEQRLSAAIQQSIGAKQTQPPVDTLPCSSDSDSEERSTQQTSITEAWRKVAASSSHGQPAEDQPSCRPHSGYVVKSAYCAGAGSPAQEPHALMADPVPPGDMIAQQGEMPSGQEAFQQQQLRQAAAQRQAKKAARADSNWSSQADAALCAQEVLSPCQGALQDATNACEPRRIERVQPTRTISRKTNKLSKTNMNKPPAVEHANICGGKRQRTPSQKWKEATGYRR